MYKQICDVLHTASKKCIPSSKIDCYKEYIVPGFNEHVKELHDIARHDFVNNNNNNNNNIIVY